MNRQDLFRAIRPYAPSQRFTSAMVAQIDQLADMFEMPRGSKPKLKNPATFFDHIRKALFAGKLTESQVSGIEAKLAAFTDAGFPIAYAAYALATSYWETARTMQPIEEYGKGKGRAYGKPGRNNGQIAYGRGDVQLTWDDNYEKADERLDLGGALIADYAKALDPAISAQIIVRGMSEGWFTGKKLADYLPTTGWANVEQFTNARPIINGTDKAAEVARIAGWFQSGLVAGVWA